MHLACNKHYLSPLIKGKLLLIHACIFKNHHKCYPSGFDLHTTHIKLFIQPLDVHIWSSSKKVSFDSVRLWQFLPFHHLHRCPKVFLQLLVFFHNRYLQLLISFSCRFYKSLTEILPQKFLEIFLVDDNVRNVVIWMPPPLPPSMPSYSPQFLHPSESTYGYPYDSESPGTYVSPSVCLYLSKPASVSLSESATPSPSPYPSLYFLCLHLRLKILLLIHFTYYIFYKTNLWFIRTYGIHCLFCIVCCLWDYSYFWNVYIFLVCLLNNNHCVAHLVLFTAA